MHTLQRLSLLLLAGLLLTSPVLAQGKGKQKKAGPKVAAVDVWADEVNVKKGAEMLGKLYEAAGGLEKWKALDGVRFDLLETWRVLTDRNTGVYKVHHYVPRLCWFETGGNGWARSELVNPRTFGAMYRREVAVGNYAWAETEEEFDHKPAAALVSRTRVNRLHFLTCMPFSLGERGAKLVFLKDLDEGKALYGMRLARPLVMRREEEIAEFVLVVDTKVNRVLQLQYSRVGADRETADASTECYVDFEGELEIGGVTLPHKHTWWFELDLRIEEYLVEELKNVAIPPASLRRPWQAGSLWKTDVRASHWDPPAKTDTPKK
jgi:hypothetical protein